MEVERGRTEPDEATENLPAPSSVYIGGDARGVQISIGSPGSAQRLETEELNLDLVSDFVAEFRRALAEFPLSPDRRDSVAANLEAAEVLLRMPKPDRRVLGPVVNSLREVVVGVAGNAAFAGLVEIAQRLG